MIYLYIFLYLIIFLIATKNEDILLFLTNLFLFTLFLTKYDLLGVTITFLLENTFFVFIGGYFYILFGFLWASYKWYMFLHYELLKYEKRKTNFIKSRIKDGQTLVWSDGILEVPPDLKICWQDIAKSEFCSIVNADLKVKDYRNKIVIWLFLWPFSLLLFMLGCFYKNLITLISYPFIEVKKRTLRCIKKDTGENP